MKKISILLLIIFSFGFTFPQIDVNQLFSNHPEVVIKFQIQDRSQLELLTRLVSIDNVFENEVTAYTNREEFEHFLSLNIPFEIVERKVLTPEELNMLDFEEIEKVRNDWNYYPTYQGYLDMMAQFAIDYPQLCRVVEFGTSVQNRKLLACVISKNVNTREAEPQVFWTSSMHGDELTGYVLTLRFIDYLLTNYGTNARITHLLDNMEIWVNPLANPDGTFWSSGARRYNANSVDLNRNYKDWKFGDHPDGKAWQKETLAFMALQNEETFVLGANLHGGAEVCNYPWDNFCNRHADVDWWYMVCREYADTAKYYSPGTTYMRSNFCNSSPSPYSDWCYPGINCYPGICHGGDWYIISGSRQDYSNYFKFHREFTLELSNTKTPGGSQMPTFWNYNYRSLLNYTEQGLYGIHGVVTDACTGEPLYAKVFVNSHDKDNSFVMTDPRVGYYARPIQSGTYTLTFESEGYQSKTITGVSSQKNNTTILNVTLQGLQEPIPYVESQIVNFETETTMGDTTITIMNKGNGALNFTATIENAESKSWLSLANNAGILCKNEETDIILSYDFTSMDCDTYETNVLINVGDSVISIPVSILFTGCEVEEEIGIPFVSIDSINIETVALTGAYMFTLQNIGNKSFDYFLDLEPEACDAWLSLSHHFGNVAPEEQDEITLTYDFTPIAKGGEIYYAELNISVNDSIIRIPITIHLLPNNIIAQEIEDIIIYPNPTTGELSIVNCQLLIENVEIFDVMGKKLFEEKETLAVLRSYDLTVFPAGIYFVRISTEKGGVMKKIIKY